MLKKQVGIALLMVVSVAVMGCSSEKTDETANLQSALQPITDVRKEVGENTLNASNLDMSNAKITIPDVDEVYELNFPVSTDTFERQLEKFEYNIRKYEGLEEDADLVPYMNIMYWDHEKNDRLVIPLDEATKEQKEQVQYIGYNDGTCSELLVFSNFMLEMGDYATTTTLVGDQDDHSKDAYGYRSTNLGTSVATYDLDKDDISNISYHLSDGDLLLTEAVDYVEKHMKEDYYFVGSEYLDYSVFGIDVRKLTDEIYYYEFDVGTVYDGVALNHDDATSLDSMNGDSGKDNLTAEPFGTNHLVTMFEKDKLGFIWSCCQNFESVQTLNTYDKVLPLDVVCETLSNYISKDKQFQISSIELLYQTEFEYENEEKREWGYIQSIHCRPVYHFSIENTGLSEYRKMYFDVDAITGDITTMVY